MAAYHPDDSAQIDQPERPKLLQIMGPGLITGASDDDPSGIATYSQAGAQFGYDLGAMAAALKLLIGGNALFYVAGFGILSLFLQLFVRFARYVSLLKWLTLSLFAYVGVALAVHAPRRSGLLLGRMCFWCLRWASSAQSCSQCPCWQVRRPML